MSTVHVLSEKDMPVLGVYSDLSKATTAAMRIVVELEERYGIASEVYSEHATVWWWADKDGRRLAEVRIMAHALDPQDP